MKSKEEKDEYILQYVSDLHLEMRKPKTIPTINPIKPGKSYLALCGDIGSPFIETYKVFLDIHTKLFVHILIVSGNHEYYSSKTKQYTMSDVENKLRNFEQMYDNVTYLNMNSIIINRTKFIGCILWSDITKVESEVENMMNDYSNIYIDSIGLPGRFLVETSGLSQRKRYIKPNRTLLKSSTVLELHHTMKEWLYQEINSDDSDKSYNHVIVLTHHAPSFKLLERDDMFSVCYATDCENMMKPYVKYWISGHTHLAKEIKINDTVCLSNCLGYPSQKINNYDSNRYIVF